MKKTNFYNNGNWYKGNLHTHSTCSDGDLSPEIVAAEYEKHGYDFLSFTDHDRFFIHPQYCSNRLLLIPGFELSATVAEGKSAHFNIYPKTDNADFNHDEHFSVKTVEETKAFTAKHSGSCLITLNHPNWSLLEWQEVINIEGISCVEVLNYASEWLDCLGEASAFWETMLRKGKHWWGIAADDNHNGYTHLSGWPFHLQQTDSFGGWVSVKAKELTAQSILKAIEDGSFYSSTGPQIKDFFVEDGWVYVTCSPCERIIFSGNRRHIQRSIGTGITEYKTKLKGDEKYIRARCVDSYGRSAYTNPIFLE